MRDPASRLADDEAEFDQITASLGDTLTGAELTDAKAGWLIGRKLLRDFPGGAVMLANMTATEFAL